jgi:pimeloyl-ACP methyl ester carboxylesterase
MVLLPPAYADPEDFIDNGFVSAVREREGPLELRLVELRMQHLLERTVLRHLRHEIVLPERVPGCSLWLAGVSLGGFVALAYAERYPTEVDGLCLLAPYLGSHIVIGEIERAGGLHGWEPGELAEDEDERRVWRFIQSHTQGAAGPGKPALHLGFGSEDRFAASHRLMAAALAPSAVHVIPGGHDWRAWRRLWENFLDATFAV